MKKALIYTAILTGLAFGQNSKVVEAGVVNFLGANITFGGNSSLAIGSGTDTVSDPFVSEISTIRPGTFTAFEYKAIAADSNASAFSILVESRYCTNAVTSSGCSNQWLRREYRKLLNDQRFADSMYVSKVPEDTTQLSNSTLVPTGNQWRIRVKGSATLDSNYTNFWKAVGY